MDSRCLASILAASIALPACGDSVTSTSTGAGGSGSTGQGGGSSIATGSGATVGTGSSTSVATSAQSSSSGGDCSPECEFGLACCDGACVNVANDILNCGACGTVCGGEHPFCNGSTCVQAPCEGGACDLYTFCCGSLCCTDGQLCCNVEMGGPSAGLTCQDPVNGTCPIGCVGCE
jgi:hypothetical protein